MVKKLDGSNTKLAALASILSGLATLILQFAGMPHDLASVLAFAKTFAMNPAWLAIIAGWGALGIGNKLDKNTAALNGTTPVAQAPRVSVSTSPDGNAVRGVIILALMLGASSMGYCAPVTKVPAKTTVTAVKTPAVITKKHTVVIAKKPIVTVAKKPTHLAEKDYVPHAKQSKIPDKDKKH
jgi:hypothetical protein